MMQLSVLILAGGRSRRMGQDKVWMPLDGVPLVARVVRRVLPVAGEILFSANDGERFQAMAATLAAEGVSSRVVADLFPGAGPLAGIHAGLLAAQHDLLLAVAADMPFVNLALIRHMAGLAEGFDAVVPRWRAGHTGEPKWEPLHALYRPRCAPVIAARLATDQRQVISFLSDVRTRPITAAEVARHDPDGLSFYNINTLADWQRAQALLAHAGMPAGTLS